MANDRDQPMVPYESTDRMSTSPSEGQPPTRPRQIFIRREHMEAFQTAVHDVNVSVDNCLQSLRGEVFVWAQQLNNKVDISLTESINVVGSELRTSSQDLEVRMISRLNEATALSRQHALDTETNVRDLDLKLQSQQSRADDIASRYTGLAATVNSNRASIFDNLMEKLEAQKQEILNEMHDSSVATNQRIRQMETRYGRLPRMISELERKTNDADAVQESMKYTENAIDQLSEKHDDLKNKVSDQVSVASNKLDSVDSSFSGLHGRMASVEERLAALPQAPCSLEEFRDLSERLSNLERPGLSNQTGSAPASSSNHAASSPAHDIPMCDNRESHLYHRG